MKLLCALIINFTIKAHSVYVSVLINMYNIFCVYSIYTFEYKYIHLYTCKYILNIYIYIYIYIYYILYIYLYMYLYACFVDAKYLVSMYLKYINFFSNLIVF